MSVSKVDQLEETIQIKKSDINLEISNSSDSEKSFEIIWQHHAIGHSLGLIEAVDLATSNTNKDSDDLQLLSLPESKECRIMIRGGSNAGGLKIQKTFAFMSQSKNNYTRDNLGNQVYFHDLLFITGMGLSTWLLRNILKT